MDEKEKLVLEKIDSLRDEIIQFHQKIVQIPSENPPSKYKEIAKFTENKFKELGLKTKTKRKNVVGEMGEENGKSLIFYGHLDTVEAFKGWSKDPFGGELIEDKIYGRGASDDKSCVTAEIFAVKALQDLNINLKGKLTITAVVDEETGGLRGAEYLLNNEIISGDACLLGDAPAGQPIGYTGGAIFATFTITGKQAHGMNHPDVPKPYRTEHSGINAIQRMVKLMNFLLDLKKELNKNETKYELPPGHKSKVSDLNLAEIHGGNKISIVPGKCFLHISINTIPEQPVEPIKERIMNYIDKMKEEDPLLDITVQMPIVFEPGIINENSEFADVLMDSVTKCLGEEKNFATFIPTTDAHWFQEKGIETALIGTIRPDNKVHAEDEFVYIEDLINITKIYALTALNYLK
ncbi:MAG: M20/M25/M40 family metallo-hydrolase [Candidatus Lokiarchaeota archaeon]|nr:M20/M25/M40 family metallo-hydrolase [Candidatus Lokiarchaeota archaeon]MBD3200380.1 M20/M25/M40 family metallo-hydrolase [Candidatus Lokiarchaeota archaeon]